MKNRDYRLGTTLVILVLGLLIVLPAVVMAITTFHPVYTGVLGRPLYLGPEDDDVNVTGGVYVYTSNAGTRCVTLRAWEWGYAMRFGP